MTIKHVAEEIYTNPPLLPSAINDKIQSMIPD